MKNDPWWRRTTACNRLNLCKNSSKDTSVENHRRIQSQLSSVQDRTLHKLAGMESHSAKSVKNQPKTINKELDWSKCPIAHFKLTATSHVLPTNLCKDEVFGLQPVGNDWIFLSAGAAHSGPMNRPNYFTKSFHECLTIIFSLRTHSLELSNLCNKHNMAQRHLGDMQIKNPDAVILIFNNYAAKLRGISPDT